MKLTRRDCAKCAAETIHAGFKCIHCGTLYPVGPVHAVMFNRQRANTIKPHRPSRGRG